MINLGKVGLVCWREYLENVRTKAFLIGVIMTPLLMGLIFVAPLLFPDEDKRILIVAHEGSNAVILSHLLGIEPVPWAWMRFSSGFTGVSRVHTKPVASGHVWVLSEFNNRGHLASIPEAGRAITSLGDLAGKPSPPE